MQDSVFLIASDAQRRRLLRHALERRGCVVAGEAGSIPEVIWALASLDGVPRTILVAADTPCGGRLARMLKRTWPQVTVIHEAPGVRPIRLPQAAGA